MRECQLCKNCFADEVVTCPNDGMPTAHTIAGEPVLEGKYHLERRLGQGGMGVVYRARHAYLKTQLAIKIILPDLVGNDPQLVTRFRQEALAAAAIRHQNVVSVTDYGVIQGSVPFLVMEYVEGESLHDLLTREKVLDPERAFELISAICAGVGAAHHQGIVHRDLKPLNIMICSDKPSLSQSVKILDFGLAKIKSGELLGSFIQAQTTGLMGSPYYMAPEQWADDEPDGRSDIYSLGVMLFQMLTGDVPFKGSSIPAIMKKHISDPPPTFAEIGVSLTPELESAVRHSLQKEKENRTSSVEVMIAELREAIYPMGIGIHTTSGGALPVSSVNIHTRPPKSKVYVDNINVGETRDDGWITLNGIQSGNHHIRVSHDGYPDWQADINCDGKPKQLVADLSAANVAPTVAFNADFAQSTPHNLGKTHPTHAEFQETAVQTWEGDLPGVEVESQKPKRSVFLSPLVLGGAGLMLLFVLGVLGLGGAYMAGLIGPKAKTTPTPAIANSSTPNKTTPTDSPATTVIKADMASIPGGTFKMGSNNGPDDERPEHEETVGPFKMDKTEVTNAEYYDFVRSTGYKKIPGHWVNGRPLDGQENAPVRFVDMDDVNAFIEWRSKRDGVKYRLPTEQEWEYAARNGSKNNRFPWGDSFKAGCAFVDKETGDPGLVATSSCPNDWGVQDLIGNVIEWTSSVAWAYPGSAVEVAPSSEPKYAVRGGSALYKSTGKEAVSSTFRRYTTKSTKNAALGFRLVQSQ
ncbi:MAG TPA: bifunctional serine/threonine-protein kinase/formylglycine-generating enzyme family protein [Pyrinomonadaceae bacterium]|nr:bifunctional serine/threonine-protein kinase/formylglycine-generating enzyme family protein [Pyrinomonadaceae bacterium]